MGEIEKRIILTVKCETEDQAQALEELLIKITPNFKGKTSIIIEDNLANLIERENKKAENMGFRRL